MAPGLVASVGIHTLWVTVVAQGVKSLLVTTDEYGEFFFGVILGVETTRVSLRLYTHTHASTHRRPHIPYTIHPILALSAPLLSLPHPTRSLIDPSVDPAQLA